MLLAASRYWRSWLSAAGTCQVTFRLVVDAGDTLGAQGDSPTVSHSSITEMVTVMVAVSLLEFVAVISTSASSPGWVS